MSQPADTGGGLLEKILPGTKSEPKTSSGSSDLKRTLGKLNSAIDALPNRIQTAVSTAEITISPPV